MNLAWPNILTDRLTPLALEWALLLALAALAGHLAQRYTRLPHLAGYVGVGVVAGWLGLPGIAWPLEGMGLFLLEMGLTVALFEAGSRLSLNWLRRNPMALVQSVAESALTFAAAFVSLHALGLELPVVRALSMIAVAASPSVLMRVMLDLRASGPVSDRALALATLNTFYALTIGTAMLRTIDRGGGTMLASMALSAAVLGISLLCGAALAGLLAAALRMLRPSGEDTAIVLLALLAVCAGITAPLGGSAPLAALLGGVLLKHWHPRPWVWPRQLGTAAQVLNILMFVLVSATAAQAGWSFAIAGAVAALVAARLAAKVVGVAATGAGTGMALKKSFWAGIAMAPMSAVALLLTSQFVAASHGIGAQVAAIALPVILVTELLGAALVTAALRRAGETAPGSPSAPAASQEPRR